MSFRSSLIPPFFIMVIYHHLDISLKRLKTIFSTFPNLLTYISVGCIQGWTVNVKLTSFLTPTSYTSLVYLLLEWREIVCEGKREARAVSFAAAVWVETCTVQVWTQTALSLKITTNVMNMKILFALDKWCSFHGFPSLFHSSPTDCSTEF